jgi:hypothetical protein
MKETNTAIKVAIFLSLGFTIYYYLNPIKPEFRITNHLLSQEEYIIEKEKILIDRIKGN